MRDASGPVFPVLGKENSWDETGGISLREYAAIKIAQRLVVKGCGTQMLVKECVSVADALLAELERTK